MRSSARGLLKPCCASSLRDLGLAGARRPEQRDDAHVLLGADDHVLEQVQEIAAHALLPDDLGADRGVERLHVAGELLRIERIDGIAGARLEEGVGVLLLHRDGPVAGLGAPQAVDRQIDRHLQSRVDLAALGVERRARA